MKNNLFKGAVVGCGAVANHTHIAAWKSSKDVEILAVCDVNAEAASKTAQRWNIPDTYTDFSIMLEAEKFDFIDICTPPITHFELAMQAMKGGIHVVVEKPIAPNAIEAAEMVSTARKHNIKLCVTHNLLFSPVIRQAKCMVDKGAIGDVLNVDIQHLSVEERHLGEEGHWCHDSSLPGRLFHEIAPHPSYLAIAFLGDVSLEHAITQKYSEYQWVSADELKVLLKSKHGLGSFNTSYNSPRDFIALNISGTKGSISIDHMTQVLIFRWPRSNKLHGFLMDRLDLVLPVLTSAANSAVYRVRGKIRNRTSHEVLIHKFLESMRNDTEPPVTGEDGLKVVRLLDEIWKQLGSIEEDFI
jgi:predicted dehydrogenase